MVEVSQPRVLDWRIVGRRRVEVAPGETVSEDFNAQGRPVECFCSAILPPYLRKTKAIEELIPWLYLKGVRTAGKAKVVGKALTVMGGSVVAFKVFGKYLSRFAKDLSAGDWVKPRKINDAFVKAARQFLRMSESKLVRVGGATDEAAGECTGRAMKLLAERGRSLSDTAAAGKAKPRAHHTGRSRPASTARSRPAAKSPAAPGD